jgi:hypothetical protein
MTGGLYVVSECHNPETGETQWKRTEAVDGVTAIGLCRRLDQRGIYSRIVATCERYRNLPVAVDWDKFAADWFREPAPATWRREHVWAMYGART